MDTIENSNGLQHLLLIEETSQQTTGDHEEDERIIIRSCTTTMIGMDEITKEVCKQVCLAGPLVIVGILQFSIQLISIMFVGHLGELSLSSASIATSFSTVTAVSVLSGMASALETLCGQSYGAKQHKMLGIYTQRAILCLVVVTIPLAIVLYNTGEILMLCGQDTEISTGAGTFNRWMIPSLFGYAILQCLNRFLQAQNIVVPMLICSGITSLLHFLVCWVLIFKLELGIKGAALANDVSYWINAILLGIYVKFSPSCNKSWTSFSREALHDIWGFLKLAVPSAFMICLEYGSVEMVVLLSGLLPNPKLETSVLSISLNTFWLMYMISFGLGGTISTRVSNELGAGRPQAAKLSLFVMVIISVSEGMIVVGVAMAVQNVWGSLYSNEIEVVNYVAKMMPLLALSGFLNGFQCVLSGAARGCGWQKMCAFINLGAYYMVGIPCAVILAFLLGFGGMGLWIGVTCGLCVQNIALGTVNLCTNWEQEATKALVRVRSPVLGSTNF